jgi:signal transduction histidine kinase
MEPNDALARPRPITTTGAHADPATPDLTTTVLAATVAHDVNNMLAVVIGSIEQVGLQLPPTHPAFLDLSVARDAAERAAGMTKRLMRAAAPPALTAVDVNGVVTSALPGLRRILGSRIQLTCELARDLWPAHTDGEQLWQVVCNLACTAREAMPDGGSLRIRTRNTTLTSHCTTATRTVTAGDYVALEVADTGAGMAPNVQQRMFEPHFSTRAQTGRGLGMSAVARFVQESRGGVRVRSEIGRGTAVELLLPRSIG